MHFRLVIDIDYDEYVAPDEDHIYEMLKSAAKRLMDEGLLSDPKKEILIDDWKYTIMKIDGMITTG